MPCKRGSTHIKISDRSHCTIVQACSLQLPMLSTAGLFLPCLDVERSCGLQALHFCALDSLPNLVPAVHVMRSCCNHNVASTVITNFRQNPNDG
jgi:hypothetical protein